MLLSLRSVLAVLFFAAIAVQSFAQSQSRACLPCHPAEVERFTNSPMGRSLSTGVDAPGGVIAHKASGSTITIYRKDGVLHHKLEERGLTADYPIAYAIGYGLTGRSFAIDIKGNLFQSPASWYTSQKAWEVSPGYQSSRLLDFTRALQSDCLVCHAGSITKKADRVELTPLSCDRCHGDPTNHLKTPVPRSIVNPAKLSIRERDSVCEQCHLEGATTVLNPGKSWGDFKPGMPLEAVETHYLLKNEDGTLASLPAVSHPEQLAVSACFRGSSGKLWCGTCHDPHGAKADRKTEIRQVCTSCHTQSQLAASHAVGQDDCVGCHMPRRAASDISHAAVTDHRILRDPRAPLPSASKLVLAAWRPALADLTNRNLGLAYFHVARAENSGIDYQRSYDLLSKLPDSKDPEVAAAVGYMLLGSGNAAGSLSLFHKAIACQPENSEYWLDLAVAQQSAGHESDAVSAYRRAIDLSPLSYRSYQGLSQLYKSAGDTAQADEVLGQFLALVPQSITARTLQ